MLFLNSRFFPKCFNNSLAELLNNLFRVVRRMCYSNYILFI